MRIENHKSKARLNAGHLLWLQLICLLFCNLTLKAQDSNVLIGLDGPAYGVKIKANFASTGGWARGYSVVNQNDSQYFFGLGAYGSISDGVSKMVYGYIGPAYNTSYMYFLPNGNVGVGTKSSTSKLTVNGTIQAKEINVSTDWADYVFAPNYRLLPLDSVEYQIRLLGRLPDMPSSYMVQKNGLDVGDMIKMQQQKIEELTLYILQQEQSLKAVISEISELKSIIKK